MDSRGTERRARRWCQWTGEKAERELEAWRTSVSLQHACVAGPRAGATVPASGDMQLGRCRETPGAGSRPGHAASARRWAEHRRSFRRAVGASLPSMGRGAAVA
jgi:hypothetical protein